MSDRQRYRLQTTCMVVWCLGVAWFGRGIIWPGVQF